MRTSRLIFPIAIALVVLPLVNACTSANDEPDAQFHTLISQALEREDLEPAVREILESASAKGQVTAEHYAESLALVGECARGLGMVFNYSPVDSQGSVGFETSLRLPEGIEPDSVEEEQALQLFSDCRSTWSGPVTAVYFQQPVFIEALNADFAPYREDVVECLRGLGEDVSGDENYVELETRSAQLAADGAVYCPEEAGYLAR